ncbi:MAG: hypothetical protein ACLSCE_16585 [Bacteroides cellulosilyticus]
MNGIPLRMSGITNDAYNLILMHRDLNTRKYLALQLAVNAGSSERYETERYAGRMVPER